MDLTHLQSFYRVVQAGGFSAAAESYGCSKGMLSRHVSALERALQTRLLQRTTRRQHLTEAGHQLYQQAEQIFADLRAAEQEITALTQEESGHLRFTCPASLGDQLIGPVMQAFTARCPQVTVALNFTNRPLDLIAEEHDIALRATPSPPANLSARLLGHLRDVVVVSPRWLMRYGRPASPQQLPVEHCFLQGDNPAWEQWHFRQGAQAVSLTLNGHLRANQYSSLLQLAMADVGIAKCPLLIAAPALQRGELVTLLDDWQTSVHPLYLLHVAQPNVPRKIQIFSGILQQWFQAHPQYLL
ncbi:MAG: LysR family transcriptional regulator [Plesiomonas shigelloides]